MSSYRMNVESIPRDQLADRICEWTEGLNLRFDDPERDAVQRDGYPVIEFTGSYADVLALVARAFDGDVDGWEAERDKIVAGG